MPAAVRTLGFSSRTDAVVYLRGQGLSTKQIAQRVGIAESNVTALEASRARKIRAVPEASVELGRGMVLAQRTVTSLRRPASARGVSVSDLARRIVEVVVENGLIDAVLDDGDA